MSGASPPVSPKNPRGATPMMVNACARSLKVLPTTDGSLANRRVQ